MRPDLFRVVLAIVPFVDVLTTMQDPTIPLTVTEWQEWGNPTEESFYNYMAQYSPVDNVRQQAYPSILVTSGYVGTSVYQSQSVFVLLFLPQPQ